MKMVKRMVVAVVVGAVVMLVIGGVVVACCTPQLVTSMMRPHSASFDDEVHPPAPDYSSDNAWLALPGTVDDADVALPAFPAVDVAAAAVDVFYLHSTSSLQRRWNSSAFDEEIRTASQRGGTLIQASAFNGCCRVFAPEYRQASGDAFTAPSPSGEQAKNLALGDVTAAFREFRRRTGPRPFIVAGHSQGSVLGAQLLKEVIASSDERSHLVAAYLIGAPLSVDDVGGVPACASPTQTSCVVTWNARGVGHTPNPIDFQGTGPEDQRLCVNPVLGMATSSPSSPAQHHGAVFFDAKVPAVLPAFLGAQCSQGRLVVSDVGPLPERDVMSGVLLWVMGGTNFHPVEYQLFYVDLRLDAARRVASFVPAD